MFQYVTIAPRARCSPCPQYLYYDTHNAAGLAEEVYAPEIDIDYTAIFGGNDVPRHDGKKWADSVIEICKAMSSHQHSTSYVSLSPSETRKHSSS